MKVKFNGQVIFNIVTCIGICLLVILFAGVDSVGPLNIVPFIVLCIIAVALLVVAHIMNDPNRLIRHLFAIHICFRIFRVDKFSAKLKRGEHIFLNKWRKYNKNYIKLYRYGLRIWDIITYNEPTSRYSECDEYGRYYLKDEYNILVNKVNK